MSRLGDSIKSARLKNGLSEKALAKKCGMAESFIKDIESGKRIISDEQAQRVLKVLGVKDPVSTELEVAKEGNVKLRPKPRPYRIEPEAENVMSSSSSEQANSQWLDALSGVVKRVPVMGPDGMVVDHIIEPVTGGKIEGANPDKVIYYRMPDDSLRGWRIYSGDLILIVPANSVTDGAFMLIEHKGSRILRKVNRQDGGRMLLQSLDRDFDASRVEAKDVTVFGRAVRLRRML